MALYELAVMGAPTGPQIGELERRISEITDLFGLRLGHEIGWSVLPDHFAAAQKTPAAVAFFGADNVSSGGLDGILRTGIRFFLWLRWTGALQPNCLINLDGLTV